MVVACSIYIVLYNMLIVDTWNYQCGEEYWGDNSYPTMVGCVFLPSVMADGKQRQYFCSVLL